MYRLLLLVLLLSLICSAVGYAQDAIFVGDRYAKLYRGATIYTGDGTTEYPVYEGDRLEVGSQSTFAKVYGLNLDNDAYDFTVAVSPNSVILFTGIQGNNEYGIKLDSDTSAIEVWSGYHLSSLTLSSAINSGKALRPLFYPSGRKVRVIRRHAYAVGRASWFEASAHTELGQDFLRIVANDNTIVDGYWAEPGAQEQQYIVRVSNSPFNVPAHTSIGPPPLK